MCHKSFKVRQGGDNWRQLINVLVSLWEKDLREIILLSVQCLEHPNEFGRHKGPSSVSNRLFTKSFFINLVLLCLPPMVSLTMYYLGESWLRWVKLWHIVTKRERNLLSIRHHRIRACFLLNGICSEKLVWKKREDCFVLRIESTIGGWQTPWTIKLSRCIKTNNVAAIKCKLAYGVFVFFWTLLAENAAILCPFRARHDLMQFARDTVHSHVGLKRTCHSEHYCVF